MVIGRFFKICKESKVHQGEYIYRYLKVCEKKKNSNYYPIHIAFKNDRINFYYIGVLESLSSKSASNKEKEFVNTILFSLPLCEGNKANNELNTTLDWIICQGFPVMDKFNINKDFFLSQNDWYYNNDNISETLNWGLEKNEKASRSKLFLRELFLDFLFDFNHTELFSSNPYYSMAKNQLFQNFYFEAISAKANFYYHLFTTVGQKKHIADFEKDVINKAKKRWANILMNPDADKYIYEKKPKINILKECSISWFSDIEDELYTITDQFSVSEIDKKDYSHWFSKRHNLFKAFFVFTNIKNLRASQITFFTSISLVFISFLCLLYFKNIFYYYINPLIITACFLTFLISLFHIEKSDFQLFNWKQLKFLKVYLSIKESFSLIGLSLIIILSTTWYIVAKSEYLLSWCIEKNNHMWLLFDILLISLSFLLIFNNEIDIRPNAKRRSSFKKSLFIFLVALFYSFNISLFIGSANIKSILAKDEVLQEIWKQTKYFKAIDKDKDIDFLPNDSKNYWSKSSYYIDSLSTNEKDIILRIIQKKNKPTKKELDFLFVRLQYLKRIVGKEPFIYVYDYFVDNEKMNFELYVIPSLLWGQITLTLFLGIFIQIIIQRKPLSG